MERFDVVLTGLDPKRPRNEVVAALARRLTASAAEIERLVDSAPSTLARAIAPADAQRLVEELRKLGARVKPRAGGPEVAVADDEPATDAGEAPPSKIELLYWSADEDGYDRPRQDGDAEGDPEPAPQIAPTPEIEPAPLATSTDPPLPEPSAPSAAASLPTPTPIVVRSDWFAPAAAPAAPAPALELAAAPPAPSPARRGLSASLAPDRPERPRVFFRALPDALLFPLRPHARRGLALASLLSVGAMTLAVLGLRSGPLLVALSVAMAVGFVGLILQVAGSCLAAAARGESMPAPLPERLMDDYLYPGVGVAVALGVLGALTGYASIELAERGAPPFALGILWACVTLYGVIGFALSAANGSPIGYLDLGRIFRIVIRSPIRALVVGAVGSTLLGGAGLGAAWLITKSIETSEPLAIALYVGGLGSVVSLVASYGAALTGALMGVLLHAKPEVTR